MTSTPASAVPVLEVRGLEVTFGSGHSAAKVLKGVSATIERGKTQGIVGESGS